MAVIRTACTYDCPDACGLLVDTSGEELVIRGDPEHPITRGAVCYRVRRHARRLSAPDRLTSPRLRTPSGWRDVCWDEALDLVAGQLAEALAASGASSVVLIDGGGSLGLSKELIRHFFCSLGPVTTLSGGLCGEAGEAAQLEDFGEAACHDYTDLAHAGAVVLWGKNPVETGMHLVPFLREAKERGATVILVEPRHSESARLADRIITVAPGGDGLLALAVLRLLSDRGQLDPAVAARAENHQEFWAMLTAAGMEAAALAHGAGAALDEVEALADLYARSSPTATLVGWGLQRHAAGGFNLRCIDALGLLSGNVGRPGSGVNYTSWRRRGLDGGLLCQGSGRTISAPYLGRDLAALCDPCARFVYVAGANPVTQCPDSAAVAGALRGAGFTVVADAFFTDTAEAADLVLPVALMLEEDDVVGSYQHHHVARAQRVVAPPEGAREDPWILRELGRRMGLPQDPLLADPGQTMARLTAPWGLGAEGWALNPAQAPVPFAGDFPTPSGKARLMTDLTRLLKELNIEHPAETESRDGSNAESPLTKRLAPGNRVESAAKAESIAAYPLIFISTSSRRWQASQLPEQDQCGPVDCTVHPDAAAAAGVEDGDLAGLESSLGSMKVRVRVEQRMHPNACVVHRGGWLRHGRCVNALVQARATDLGQGAAFYHQRVRLTGKLEG